MNFRSAFVSVGVLLVLLAAARRQAHAQGTYTQIDVPGALFTQCFGVNTKGDLVGLYEDASGVDHGFLLSGGVYTDIDDLGWSLAVPSGIDDEGQIVGYVSNYPAFSGFLYDVGAQAFTELNYPGATITIANGINNAGNIVGYYEVGEAVTNGFELVGSAYSEISRSSAVMTQAYGITSAGYIFGVVNWPKQEVPYNFAYFDAKFKNLNLPAGFTLTAVNPEGTVLAGIFMSRPGQYSGWVYRSKKYIFISFPGSTETLAYGINRGDEIVGWFVDSSDNVHGFRWEPPSDASPR